MDTIVFATWGLVFFTAVLAGATIYYACVAKKLYKASKEQAKALKELTKAILQLPIIEEHIQLQKKLREEAEKEQRKNQEMATKGH